MTRLIDQINARLPLNLRHALSDFIETVTPVREYADTERESLWNSFDKDDDPVCKTEAEAADVALDRFDLAFNCLLGDNR